MPTSTFVFIVLAVQPTKSKIINKIPFLIKSPPAQEIN